VQHAFVFASSWYRKPFLLQLLNLQKSERKEGYVLLYCLALICYDVTSCACILLFEVHKACIKYVGFDNFVEDKRRIILVFIIARPVINSTTYFAVIHFRYWALKL
jgi:hypothetical protein